MFNKGIFELNSVDEYTDEPKRNNISVVAINFSAIVSNDTIPYTLKASDDFFDKMFKKFAENDINIAITVDYTFDNIELFKQTIATTEDIQKFIWDNTA